MKIYLQLLALILLVAPASVIAQDSIKESVYKPEQLSQAIDSVSKSNLKFFNQPLKSKVHFPNLQLPKGLQNHTEIVAESLNMDPRYRYNMPIAKLESTSKILIATLDPDFPYHYNMPIKKPRTGKD